MLAGLLLLSLGVQDLVRARVDLEPKDLWAVLGGLLRVPQMAVRHEEEVRKCGPKVGPVVVALELGPRVVDVLTLWAEDLDRVVLRLRVAPELRIVGGWFCFGFDLI